MLNGGTYLDNEIHEIFVVRQDVDEFVLQDGEVDEVMWINDLAGFVVRDDVVPHREEYDIVMRIVR